MRKIIVILFLVFASNSFCAVDSASCGTKVVNYIKVINPEITGTAETKLIEMWTEICKGILEEITTNATVTVTGVMSGGSTAPGTIQ